MAVYGSRAASQIPELIARQGEVSGRAAAQSGMLWARALENVGGIAGQAIMEHQQQKQQEEIRRQREAAFTDALGSWDPGDPRKSIMRLAAVTGPEDAIKFGTGLMQFESTMKKAQQAELPSMEELQASLGAAAVFWKNAPGTFQQYYPQMREVLGPGLEARMGIRLPEQPTPEIEQALSQLAGTGKVQKAETIEQNGQVFERQADGTWKPAVGLPVEAKEAKAPSTVNVGGRVKQFNPQTGQFDVDLGPTEAAIARSTPGSKSKMWVVRDGQTIRISEDEYRPGDQPTGMRERPSTGAERRVLSFYTRAKEASDTLESLEEKIQGSNLFQQARQQWLPNMLQSDDEQIYRQAQRAFTEARLRKDSGATIKKDEYESDAKTYFAQPGDSKAVLEKKRRGREQILAALKAESGRAYAEHFGDADAPVTVESIERVP